MSKGKEKLKEKLFEQMAKYNELLAEAKILREEAKENLKQSRLILAELQHRRNGNGS